MNKRLQLAVRNAACDLCRMCQQAEGDDVCVTGDGPNDSKVMVVTKFPARGKVRAELETYLTEAGIDLSTVMWASAIKCRTWDLEPNKTDMKACRPYLEAELANVKPDHVLLFGGEALFAATGKSGIMKYRSKTFSVIGGGTAFATISPSMIRRNPGLAGGFKADLRYFSRLVKGDDARHPDLVPGTRRRHVGSKAALRDMLTALDGAAAVAYDIETTGASEFDSDARIVSISMTVTPTTSTDMTDALVFEVPLFHPESPWSSQWEKVIRIFGPHLAKVPRRIAHNAKFDTRWLRKFGIPELTPTFDTIIAASILDENGPKGLKPLGVALLGADPWGIETHDLLNTPLSDVLEYNGLDTWHTMRVYHVLRARLKEQPRAARLFIHLLMPAIQELVGVEQAGVYVHRDVFEANWAIVKEQLKTIEDGLEAHVPDWDVIPSNLNEINFNASNFARWWLFEHLGFPILARGKTKDDGTPGAPSMAEGVMMDLADTTGHPVPQLMVDRIKWNKFDTAFFQPYSEQIDAESRLRTVFKPWGTVTGRLSSGKEDREKVSGSAASNIRGVNMQQVPRDKIVRGIFGAPPGSVFIETDYSQVELRVAAFLANETTMLHLYNTGQDIHMAMAMRMTGKTDPSTVTKEERKSAKAVNFGFLYGMGWAKFVSTAWLNYGVRVTEAEAQAFRIAFFQQFDKLPAWHQKQRRLAQKYKRVETPMGRIRHLPDVDSPVDSIRSEAERQAINSPVQAFASDMALLSLTLVMKEFRRRGLKAHAIGTVHDAVNWEVPIDEVPTALPIIKHTMENLPLERMFGINLTVPIVADAKIGTRWGGAAEIDNTVAMSPDLLRTWLNDHPEQIGLSA